MDKVLNYQMSLFGMFTNVQPNLELTMKIFESLKDEGFVPGTVQVNTVNPMGQGTKEKKYQVFVSST